MTMKKILSGTAAVLFTGITAMFLFGVNGNAYIDPSVMTYLIQAIAGVVIAVGAAVGIYFRRAKKKINKTLNIDENRNKEVESDDILLTKDTKDTKDTKAE